MGDHKQLGPPLAVDEAQAGGVSFSSDGVTFATAGERALGVWKGLLWRTPSEVREQVCGLAGSGLNRVEWAQYAPGIPYRNSCPTARA